MSAIGPGLAGPRRAGAHPLAVPALMAVLVCLVGAHVALTFKIPSWGNDEAPHLGYVVALAHGELPTIDSPILGSAADRERFPSDSGSLLGWDAAHQDIWTANHPPLYHALLVPLWWATGDDLAHAVIAMRLVNTLGYGAWVLLVALVARELVPRRPEVAALAAVLAATPGLALRSGFLMNDGWACAAALLTVLMTVRMLRAGPAGVTAGRVATAALAGVLAAGTRAPGVLVVAVCCLTLLACLRGSPRGVVAAAVVGGVPALATGWFYLRNLRLYGDLTGQDALLEKFGRSPVRGWAELAAVPGLAERVAANALPLLLVLLLVPVVLVRRVREPGIRRAWLRPPDAAWTMLGLHAVLTVASVAAFVRAGGGLHDRYLMPIAPLLATGAALVLLAVVRQAAVWAAVLLAWFAGSFAVQEWWFVLRPPMHHPVEGPLPALLLVAAVPVGVLVVVTLGRRGALAAPGSASEARVVRDAA